MGTHHSYGPLSTGGAARRSLALLVLGACARDAPAPGPLDHLFLPGDAGFLQVSSYDTSGGNRDRHEVAPGDSVVLLDVEGPGVIRRIWITVASRDPHHYRRLALRMYWDGEADPSVAVPLGDFFGNAWDRRHWASQVMGASSGGYYLYLPLPFRRHARIVVENGSDLPVDAFYFNADLDTDVRLPTGIATFHAVWNRDRRTTADAAHRVLEAEGRGQFIGLVLNAQSHAGHLGFLEGDEIFHVDGEFRGQGTGTEDYFNAGWYFDQGEFAAPFHGLIVKDDTLARIAAYRWHVPDPVRFRDSLRIELEHGHANQEVADYATVAYWYQVEPHRRLPALPPADERLASATRLPAGVVTGDSLAVTLTGDSAILRIPVPEPDRYEVLVWPYGVPAARPVNARVSGARLPRELERDAAAPGPLPPVVLDTLAATVEEVGVVVTGPAAATAVSAAQLRPVRIFASDWMVAGPVPNPQQLGSEYSVVLDSLDHDIGASGAVTTAGGEALTWQPAGAGPDGQVRLNPLFRPNEWVAAFARSWLYSTVERDATLWLGADDAHILWVNGEEVSRRQGRNISIADDMAVPVRLRSGWNAILLLVADLDGGWGFHLRVADPTGELRWARDPGD